MNHFNIIVFANFKFKLFINLNQMLLYILEMHIFLTFHINIVHYGYFIVINYQFF